MYEVIKVEWETYEAIIEKWSNLQGPFPPKEWRKFKAEMLEKWLKPVNLPDDYYREADEKYETFMRQKRLMAQLLRKHGEKIDSWELKEGSERKAGWRAQKWFSEMLFCLRVTHWSDLKTPSLSDQFFEIDLKKLGIPLYEWKNLYYYFGIAPDINISDMGTVEIKSMEVGAEVFDVKKRSWESRPSLYLAVLRTCDESMCTFQFLGWLYGVEVYKLKVQEADRFYPKTHYFGEPKELRKPKSFLKMLFRVSRANPSKNREKA